MHTEASVSDVNTRIETLEDKPRASDVTNSKLEIKTYDEKAKIDYTLMLEDLKRERQDFHNHMEKVRSEWMKTINENETSFAEWELEEMDRLCRMYRDVDRESVILIYERSCLDKDRQELELIENHIEEAQIKIYKGLKTIEKEREEFAREKRLFFGFIEQIKGCDEMRNLIPFLDKA